MSANAAILLENCSSKNSHQSGNLQTEIFFEYHSITLILYFIQFLNLQDSTLTSLDFFPILNEVGLVTVLHTM